MDELKGSTTKLGEKAIKVGFPESRSRALKQSTRNESVNRTIEYRRADGLQLVQVVGSKGEHSIEYEFPDSELKLDESGYVLVYSSLTGGVEYVIDPAWAVDRNGEPVVTQYFVEGNRLIQNVEILDEHALPVVSDPYVRDVNGPIGKAGIDVVFSAKDLAAIDMAAGGCAAVSNFIPHPYAQAAGKACGVVGTFITAGGGIATLNDKCLAVRFLGPPDGHNLVFPVVVAC